MAHYFSKKVVCFAKQKTNERLVSLLNCPKNPLLKLALYAILLY